MARRVVIIGAGIGGLAAGCHARARDWECDIFEMHDKPGGLCTTWQRGGYSFDGCIRFLLGTVRESRFHDDWERLGALRNGIARRSSYLSYESVGQRLFVLHKDMRQLLDHIAALSPMDQQPARELAEATETVRMGASRDSEDRTAPADIRRRFARIEESLNALTVAEYAKRFSHPAIQGGLRSLVPSYYSAFSLVWTLSQLSLGDGNWPLGGSMNLARSVESTFVSLGGRVHYRKRAAKIIVRGNRACGIMLDDGTEVEGDAVVAAMDVHQTLFGLLEEDRVPTRIRRWFETVRTVTPAVQISLGIRSASLDCPPHLVWELDKQATVAGTAQRVIDLLYFGDDPSMAGPGTSVMTCLVDSDYEFWKKLTPNRAAYDEEKERTAAWAIEEVCRRIPGARSCVETVDVATPVTHARMAGVWKGAYEGWNFDRATCRIRFPQTLPNLEGFYMTGQWIKPGGGLIAAMTTGNETIELIRKEEDRA